MFGVIFNVFSSAKSIISDFEVKNSLNIVLYSYLGSKYSVFGCFLAKIVKICHFSEFYILFDVFGSAKSIFDDSDIDNYSN